MSTSFPKDKIRILLLENIHQSAVDTFHKAGYTNVQVEKRAWTEEELLENIGEYHVIGIRSKTQLTKAVLQAAHKMLAVGCFCIGTNQVDLDAAIDLGIPVFNSPYMNTRSVAELVIAESIMLIRKIPLKNKSAHEGGWMKDAKGVYEIRSKTLGIIGYGHIGSQVSILAESMGMKVIYYDIEPKLPLGNAHPRDSMEAVLRESDIVTLHVPATPQTEWMIKDVQLSMMKENSMLLNLSRGNVVDIDALCKHLRSGHISGAAIDVYPEEPKSKEDKFTSPLQEFDNVILTPHIGGSTVEAQENIGVDAATKLINMLDVGSSVGSKTVPELNLPRQDDARRILHLHDNQPGVMSEINKILADLNINIRSQYLQTNSQIGYVVFDIDAKASDDALEALKKVKHTLKARILY